MQLTCSFLTLYTTAASSASDFIICVDYLIEKVKKVQLNTAAAQEFKEVVSCSQQANNLKNLHFFQTVKLHFLKLHF